MTSYAPRVLVVGPTNVAQTQHQVSVLERAGAQVVPLTPGAAGPAKTLAWDDAGCFGPGDMLDVDAVILRAMPPTVPKSNVFREGAASLSFGEWFQHYNAARDRHDTIFGLILALEQRGVPVFNPPSKSHLSRRKPFQIDVMRRLGVPHPKTLITNDAGRARSFVNSVDDVIAKPASGGALTLGREHITDEALSRLQNVPAIFQQRIYGRDLRVMVLDGEVISVADVGVPDGSVDFRGEADYQRGKIQYQEVTLPDAVAAHAGRFAEALGLRFAGVDIKMTASSEFFVLEANSSPIYLDVERKLRGHNITARFVERVVAEARRYRAGHTSTER